MIDFSTCVLEDRKRVLGEDHLETLIIMCDLADTYSFQDPVKNACKAERLELQLVESRKKVLSEEHPNTLLAIGNLAKTYDW